MKLVAPARTDGYKFTHFKQYRPGTVKISSYIEARGTDKPWKDMVFAGIQYYLKEYMSQPYFTAENIKHMKARSVKYGLDFNDQSAEYILKYFGGYLPIEIQALPEGLVVPIGTPLVQVTNTDPAAAAWVSYIETGLLRAIWYMSTVATQSFQIKRVIKNSMMRTAGHTNGLEFKLHDFGARGASSSETAQIGGAAHLFNFQGSDTFEAIEMIAAYYGEDMAAFSIDAAEHSTVTSFGGPQYEEMAYEHLINVFGKKDKIFAIVSDSYDLYNAISNIYGTSLKAQVESLERIGSKLIIRPDSGDPVIVVSDTIERLMDAFGYTLNDKGYKVLPPYLGVIQGDGINETSIKQILSVMEMRRLSAENIAFGMGGALLQGVNRDTMQFAMKANEAQNTTFNDGKPYPVFKQPKTDAAKNSKRGRQVVVETNDHKSYMSLTEHEALEIYPTDLKNFNLLETVYLNGKIKRVDTLANIRTRVNSAL